MSKKKVSLNFYNNEEETFEEVNVETDAEAIKMADGTDLETKTSELEDMIRDVADNGAAAVITVSETAPENPKDGQLWFKPTS